MTLAEMLGKFTSQELAEVLSALSLPVAGSKEERIRRLVSQGGHPNKVLEGFLAEDLRWLCGEVGVRTARKPEMVEKLVDLLDNASPQTKPEPVIRPPTKEGVLSVLEELRVPKRKAKEEYHAQDEIAAELQRHFGDVAFEYNVGGYFGHKIDLDIGNGNVGVEVKLADALFRAPEAHRLI